MFENYNKDGFIVCIHREIMLILNDPFILINIQLLIFNYLCIIFEYVFKVGGGLIGIYKYCIVLCERSSSIRIKMQKVLIILNITCFSYGCSIG